jgi:hypothetical protein
MRDVIIVAIWDMENSTATRSVVVDNKSKELKLNGKKPNKMIVPESLIDVKLLRKVKSLGAYNCKIVKAVGK